MAMGSCRSERCGNRRRVRRGLAEPPCEECCWRARRRPGAELASRHQAGYLSRRQGG
jgi:hypothetical protein